jgi:transketolase
MPLQKPIVDIFMEPIKEKNAYILYSDIGRNYIDLKYNRAVNIGIAETTMIGMACGLASEGHKVYTFCLTPHILRAWEFVRTLLVPRGYDVTVIGGGEGKDYESLGHSHQMDRDEMKLYCKGAGIPYFMPTNRDELKIVMRHLGPLFVQIPNSLREDK